MEIVLMVTIEGYHGASPRGLDPGFLTTTTSACSP